MSYTQKVISTAVLSHITRFKLTRAQMAMKLGLSLAGLNSKIYSRRYWNMNDLDRLTALGVIELVTSVDVMESAE
ncbi:hypothetical protein HMPREF0044_0116 [Gleimia coleocanis DSM 15436]|uniref:Toxin-antitoxin system, antitoxin component, Xre family n=1 Tax=Gleimia coleocanis DSM 15436 TaxID=525245 RepID=C0VY76_9ACTO|nr:hypothetical protein [Gleimia coleocanis]EEH64379.1 hypothetical protein HMPREF0044_0116 [Gleimia coleocanis DSM 15436]